MSLLLNRTCHEYGGEITTSPPINSLQCIGFRNAADSSRIRYPRSRKSLYVFLNTATPAHSVYPGSIATFSFSISTLSQSSNRPTMIVHTGPMLAIMVGRLDDWLK